MLLLMCNMHIEHTFFAICIATDINQNGRRPDVGFCPLVLRPKISILYIIIDEPDPGEMESDMQTTLMTAHTFSVALSLTR